MKIKTGDRVRVDTSQTQWLSDRPLDDLGLGTVTATTTAEDEFLMEGLYVAVDWDDKSLSNRLGRPSIQSLIVVTEATAGK